MRLTPEISRCIGHDQRACAVQPPRFRGVKSLPSGETHVASGTRRFSTLFAHPRAGSVAASHNNPHRVCPVRWMIVDVLSGAEVHSALRPVDSAEGEERPALGRMASSGPLCGGTSECRPRLPRRPALAASGIQRIVGGDEAPCPRSAGFDRVGAIFPASVVSVLLPVRGDQISIPLAVLVGIQAPDDDDVAHEASLEELGRPVVSGL